MRFTARYILNRLMLYNAASKGNFLSMSCLMSVRTVECSQLIPAASVRLFYIISVAVEEAVCRCNAWIIIVNGRNKTLSESQQKRRN